MLTSTLRAQHDRLLEKATLLSGVASARQTGDTAVRARALIEAIDGLLVEHLTIEDSWLYPALMRASDPDVRSEAQSCSEDMGGILGAWIAYRSLWDEAAISANLDRFRIVTAGIVGALAMRIERENLDLYPAMDRLLAETGDLTAAA